MSNSLVERAMKVDWVISIARGIGQEARGKEEHLQRAPSRDQISGESTRSMEIARGASERSERDLYP